MIAVLYYRALSISTGATQTDWEKSSTAAQGVRGLWHIFGPLVRTYVKWDGVTRQTTWCLEANLKCGPALFLTNIGIFLGTFMAFQINFWVPFLSAGNLSPLFFLLLLPYA